MALHHDSNSTRPRRDQYGGEAGRRFQDHSEEWIDEHDGVTRRHDPGFVDDDATRPDDAISIDEVIQRLSRDMSDAVNRAPMDERDELRTYATELVREDTSSSVSRLPTRRARLSFFAVAVWLALAGAVLSFLLPSAGIVCFFMAGVSAVLAAILGPGEAQPEPTTDSPNDQRAWH
jgi:hypothetical protein